MGTTGGDNIDFPLFTRLDPLFHGQAPLFARLGPLFPDLTQGNKYHAQAALFPDSNFLPGERYPSPDNSFHAQSTTSTFRQKGPRPDSDFHA